MDANFRLARQDVSNDSADPGLSRGWAYFVENTKYRQHLKDNDDLPQEVRVIFPLSLSNDLQPSDCASHTAVNNNFKHPRGLAATGIAAVDCA